MFSKAPRRASVDLDVIPFAFEAPPADLQWVRCAHCQDRLALHQPDLQSPSRLLGICGGCRRWYLIVLETDHGSAMMVVLPEDRAFQAAWETHEGPG